MAVLKPKNDALSTGKREKNEPNSLRFFCFFKCYELSDKYLPRESHYIAEGSNLFALGWENEYNMRRATLSERQEVVIRLRVLGMADGFWEERVLDTSEYLRMKSFSI